MKEVIRLDTHTDIVEYIKLYWFILFYIDGNDDDDDD